MDTTANGLSVTFYGIRGSALAYRDIKTRYGIHTSCTLVRAADITIVIDLGSGALAAGDMLARETGELYVLLSHMHLDHLQGLPFFAPLMQRGRAVHIFGEARLGMDVSAQLERYVSPPLWPVRFCDFQADIQSHTFVEGDTFTLGKRVTVQTARSLHPDKSTLFRISCDGKSLTYALDFEHSDESTRVLADFSRGSDLLVYDATYSNAEYDDGKRGWGHSTWQRGLQMWQSGATKRVALGHLGHTLTDSELDVRARAAAEASAGGCFIAREGMTVAL